MTSCSVIPGLTGNLCFTTFRAAFITVMVVPWTMPCGPMYM